MPMKLSSEEIESIARLARLDLSEQEKNMYADQLSAVLDYVEMLNEVDTSDVEETCQVTGLVDVFREDEVVDTEPDVKKGLLEAFPANTGSLLKVQAVFSDSDDA